MSIWCVRAFCQVYLEKFYFVSLLYGDKIKQGITYVSPLLYNVSLEMEIFTYSFYTISFCTFCPTFARSQCTQNSLIGSCSSLDYSCIDFQIVCQLFTWFVKLGTKGWLKLRKSQTPFWLSINLLNSSVLIVVWELVIGWVKCRKWLRMRLLLHINFSFTSLRLLLFNSHPTLRPDCFD